MATTLWHGGNSPNGMNPGMFAAVAQGVGLEHSIGSVSIAPSALLVAGRVQRSSYSRDITDHTTFAVLGVSMRLDR